ncbi:Ribosome association toxin PasT (RatA) of the RatAB toxin-antitoxin module [Flavobacteriaceae bacterium MAR_2010_188]|nr:Ribosome association toxin PasT (RatA) of the RatAB toxin-antitoxin module [Flavobacteriaceae bacterium MAR_2010_188]
MKIFKYLLFLLLILVIGAAIYIAVQPNDYTFSRSQIINAPPAVIYNKVNDYKIWPEFSPWIEKEPNAQITYNDKTVGEEAGYSWEGDDLGTGSMTTLDTNPYQSIDQQINFVEPFETESKIHWDFKPVENGTEVTWTMSGEQDFMTKMYTTFFGSVEKNTGADFERGLVKLDSLTKIDMNKYNIVINGKAQHSGGYYIYSSTSSKIDNLPFKIQEIMPKVGAYAVANNISMDGSPFIIYHEWDSKNNAVRFSTCIPTTARVITTEDDILTGQLEPFTAMKATLTGNYSYFQEAWNNLKDKIAADSTIQEAPNGPQMEVFVKDYGDNPNPSTWITEIYIAIEDI